MGGGGSKAWGSARAASLDASVSVSRHRSAPAPHAPESHKPESHKRISPPPCALRQVRNGQHAGVLPERSDRVLSHVPWVNGGNEKGRQALGAAVKTTRRHAAAAGAPVRLAAKSTRRDSIVQEPLVMAHCSWSGKPLLEPAMPSLPMLRMSSLPARTSPTSAAGNKGDSNTPAASPSLPRPPPCCSTWSARSCSVDSQRMHACLSLLLGACTRLGLTCIALISKCMPSTTCIQMPAPPGPT